MKTIEIKELYDRDYSAKVLNALWQSWERTDTFRCIGNPKRCHMLLYLDGCDAVYTQKDGRTLRAESGAIVYIPIGSEYTVTFKGNQRQTLHVNFLLYEPDGPPFALSKEIEIFRADNANYRALFHQIDRYSEANLQCRGKIKSILYDLLFRLSDYHRQGARHQFGIIANGIAYLEQDEEQALSIGEVAGLCNVSEVYFRRLFKEYAGMSPSEYRAAAKLCRAKNYLKQEALSIAEISDRLGFSDVSYFIKVFKEQTGKTPREYRNQNVNIL
ncbi:MAG: helix-turn-helix transcriptional regulator [Clostridia bacterium]|nr:helix-turn-helix transcriptional regulator [Clostridia bacterium]MBQ7090179.1 helix-turn-helix transcriptional regulator [Clostridia bacterium]